MPNTIIPKSISATKMPSGYGHGKEPGYLAAVLFFNGLANGVSARILRWWPQGVAAAIWWGCGTAMLFFTTRTEELALFVTATFCGMILFGVYAMWLERHAAAGMVQAHA